MTTGPALAGNGTSGLAKKAENRSEKEDETRTKKQIFAGNFPFRKKVDNSVKSVKFSTGIDLTTKEIIGNLGITFKYRHKKSFVYWAL